MKHDQGQFQKLPAALPEGERVIWRGKPSFKGLALRSFHIREVAIYVGLLAAWKFSSSLSQGLSAGDAAIGATWAALPGLGGIALLALLAFLFRRAANYTVTTRRVLMQFGVALPIRMNIPLGKIGSAALATCRDGSGDISLGLIDSDRVSYGLLWPHIRPWRLRAPQPTLKAVPEAAAVAAKLAAALSEQPGPAAVTRLQAPSGAAAPVLATSPASAAA